jgi:hypothetical protein
MLWRRTLLKLTGNVLDYLALPIIYILPTPIPVAIFKDNSFGCQTGAVLPCNNSIISGLLATRLASLTIEPMALSTHRKSFHHSQFMVSDSRWSRWSTIGSPIAPDMAELEFAAQERLDHLSKALGYALEGSSMNGNMHFGRGLRSR